MKKELVEELKESSIIRDEFCMMKEIDASKFLDDLIASITTGRIKHRKQEPMVLS